MSSSLRIVLPGFQAVIKAPQSVSKLARRILASSLCSPIFSIIGGGIYFEGDATGVMAIKFDSGTLDKLATQDDKGKELVNKGVAILK